MRTYTSERAGARLITVTSDRALEPALHHDTATLDTDPQRPRSDRDTGEGVQGSRPDGLPRSRYHNEGEWQTECDTA